MKPNKKVESLVLSNTITLTPASGVKTRKVKRDDLIIIPENEDMKTFFQNEMNEIYSKFCARIEHMIESGKDEVYVFLYKDKAFGVKRDGIKKTLNKMIEHCIKPENEQFELAAEAKRLLLKA